MDCNFDSTEPKFSLVCFIVLATSTGLALCEMPDNAKTGTLLRIKESRDEK